jgi:hypothetical protein
MPWPCAASLWWCALLPLALRAREAQGKRAVLTRRRWAWSFDDAQVEALCGYFAHSLALMSGVLAALFPCHGHRSASRRPRA